MNSPIITPQDTEAEIQRYITIRNTLSIKINELGGTLGSVELYNLISEYQKQREILAGFAIPIIPDTDAESYINGFLQKHAPQLPLESLIVDIAPVENGAKKSPEDWLIYWSNQPGEREMASAGDVLHDFRILKQMHDAGGELREESGRILSGYHTDFDWAGQQNYLVLRPDITYNRIYSETATIVHHKGSKLTREIHLDIPVYLGVPILKVKDSEKGARFLKALLDTENLDEAISLLEFASGKSADDIVIFTPPIKSHHYYTRSEKPNRAAGFNYSKDRFCIGGDNINLHARSRGVKVNQR